MKIGLALSGGGIRATVFHLGLFTRLAQQGLLKDISYISSVSGGSLCVGLIFSRSGYNWPTSGEFLHNVLPSVESAITEIHLQNVWLKRKIIAPWKFVWPRASALAEAIRKCWGILGKLSDLPNTPTWLINATCYQSGKNWRFSKKRMGDYIVNYVLEPDYFIADAIATSAGVPGLVGPMVLHTKNHQWHQRERDGYRKINPKFKKLHLWDGGVYENLGIEPLFKMDTGLQTGVDFLIVSDASAPLTEGQARFKSPKHLIDVSMEQIRCLRARIFVNHLKQNPQDGVYLRLGNTTEYVYRMAGKERPESFSLLSESQVQQALSMSTTLRRLLQSEYRLLFQHGYEVADATLNAYNG